MKFQVNGDYIVNEITLKYFHSPRFFNIIFGIENWQGDGYVRLTLTLFHHTLQLIVPFINKWQVSYEWRLFGHGTTLTYRG